MTMSKKKKKEESPFSAELLDAMLAEHKKDGLVSTEAMFGSDGLLQQLTKALVERALEGEMEFHLGYPKHAQRSAQAQESHNARNGQTPKKIQSQRGDYSIAVPRDRNSEFEPAIVKKGQRRFEGFDERIISMYARGLSVREIQAHLEEIYGTTVSPDLISTVTDGVMEEVRAWQNRPLEAVYPILFLDCLHVKIRSDGRVSPHAIYLVIGITLQGHKEVLGMWVAHSEGAKFWMNVLTELQNRGVEDVFIACVDGLKGFPEAFAALYPRTQVQLCLVHLVRAALAYVSYKERRAVASDLRTIYQAPTADQAWHNLEAVEAKWQTRYPHLLRGWKAHWERITPMFGYPPTIRKLIYTTNAIESLNMSLRKILKTRGSFPNENAALKLLYLGLRNIEKKWTSALQNWPAALAVFAILFQERLTHHLFDPFTQN
jgi:putative transposase